MMMSRPSSATKRHPLPVTAPTRASPSAAHAMEAAVPGLSNILVASITVRRVNIPPGPSKEFVATINLALSSTELPQTASPSNPSSLGSSSSALTAGQSQQHQHVYKITTQPEKAHPDFTSGWTLNFRELNILLPLHARYDARNGVHVSVQSTCGTVQLGTANCRQSREWFFLSKPRGEVQIAFSEVFAGSSSGGSSASGGGSATTSPSFVAGAQGALGALSAMPSNPPRPMSGGPSRGLPTPSRAGELAPRPGTLATAVGFSPRQIAPVQSRSVDFTNISVKNFLCSRDPDEYFLLQVQFAGQTKQIPAAVGAYDPVTGHSVTWSPKLNSFLIFDIPLYIKDSAAVFCLYRGTSLTDGSLAAQTSVTVDTTEPMTDTVSLQLAGRSTLTVTVSTRFREPQKEGAGGRPTSAFSRGGGGGSSSALGPASTSFSPPPGISASAGSSSGGIDSSSRMPTTPPARAYPATRMQPANAPGGSRPGMRPTDDADDDDDGYIVDDDDTPSHDDPHYHRGAGLATTPNGLSSAAVSPLPPHVSGDVDRLLHGLLTRMEHAISVAFAPIEQRLSGIEQRVAVGEERITSYLAACQGAGGVSPVPLALGSGGSAAGGMGSRPASGDSSHSTSGRCYSGVAFTSFPEHSNPLFNDHLLHAKFEAYDREGQGCISRSQLIHFYRTHNSFAYDATDDDVMEALAELARNFDTERVSFDCFCAVALKLAKS